MNVRELNRDLAQVLDDAKTAVMASVDKDGKPSLRWLTPGLLPGTPGSIFFITSPHSDKIRELHSNPNVTWLFQTRSLNRIIRLRATVQIHENPALTSEVLEAVSARLTTFWKINEDKHAMVVVESAITDAVVLDPAKGTSIQVAL